MKFVLEIKMDNVAFEEAPLGEVARILREEAVKLERFAVQAGWRSTLHDINGNSVGKAETM